MATKFAPIGTSGLRKTGGYVTSDFLPALTGQEAVRRYTEMESNDPVLGAILFAVTMLLRGMEWRVDPADPENAKAQELADFVSDELFKEMDVDFADLMSEVATMFIYGHAPCEVVYAKRDDGRLGLGRIELRGQDTIERWEFDPKTNALVGFWQNDWEHPRVFIPLDRCLLFRTETTKNNPEGRSLLRRAYVPWVRKKSIEEAEGRAAMRAAGVVVLTVPSDLMLTSASPEEQTAYAAYKSAAKALAEDRQGAIILPSDVNPETKVPLYDLKYVVADGKRSGDMSPLVERIDKRMAAVVLADFILLGQQAVGSFALSADKTQLFLAVLKAWSQMISGVFNRQLIPRWMLLNGWDDRTLYPTLVPSGLEKPDLTGIANYLATLAKAGMPLFPDDNLSAHLRELANLPEPSPEAMAQQKLVQQHELDMKDVEAEQAALGTERADLENKQLKQAPKEAAK
jgi:hypothetical protein